MPDRLPVNLVFVGDPFDRAAVVHVVRHIAMHAGWTITSNAHHKIIYATLDDTKKLSTRAGDLVILSSPSVKDHLLNKRDPIPISQDDHDRFCPFKHRDADKLIRSGLIPFDVIAGIYAVQNLWFERQNRTALQDGWIKYRDDWWFKCGYHDPFPVVDKWLDYIQSTANEIGWTQTSIQIAGSFLEKPFTLLLTHDVDYLPTRSDKGLPRLVRTLARHAITRRRPADSFRALAAYAGALFRREPYNEIETIMEIEDSRNVRSSFQIISARGHRADPSYNFTDPATQESFSKLHSRGWELCLHGSYLASRSPGQIATERRILENALSAPILGHRQHYLNFHPSQLFSEVEEAGLTYDLSVGYNDRSGPRAGTLFPYKPYNIEECRPHTIWEMPFVFMDTTLATTYRLDASKIIEHIQSNLQERRACVGIIWHQEQAGGLLDPGYDDAYTQIIDWALGQSAQLATPGSVIDGLESAWHETLGAVNESPTNSA